jgi:hypothetical protein
MKKRLLAASLLAIFLIVALSACGGNSAPADSAASKSADANGYYYATDEADFDYYDAYPEEAYNEAPAPNPSLSLSGMVGTAARTDPNPNKKIIYTAEASVETLKFEETVQAVYDMLDKFGAYIQSSSITGTDYRTEYYGSFPYRRAYFSIRVPKEQYTAMSADLETLGNLVSYSSDSNDISSQYTDTETRLAASKAEHDRLLEMMAAAETVEEMIAVEERLSEVEYYIDSLTGTLRGWQDEVDYSTINLSVNEVQELTPQPDVPPVSFWDRLVTAVKDSCEWLVDALQDIAIFIVAAIPVLIIPAVIVVAVIVIVKLARRRKRAKIAAAYAARKALEEKEGAKPEGSSEKKPEDEKR